MSSLPAGMVRACSQAGDVVYEEARPLLNQSIPVSRLARSLIALMAPRGLCYGFVDVTERRDVITND